MRFSFSELLIHPFLKLRFHRECKAFPYKHAQIQNTWALLHAEEQIREVGVVVVIHLHAAALYGAVHEHRAAAAEHIYEARIVSRGKALYYPQELALAADPRDEAFQTPSPPRKLIIEHSSPVMAASIPSRIRRRFLMVS